MPRALRNNGQRKSKTEMRASKRRAIVAEYPDLGPAELGRMLNCTRVTIWNDRKAIAAALEAGDPIAALPRIHENPLAPAPKHRDELDDEALALIEDTPAAFEAFFNRFAPDSDPKIKGLAHHSRLFIEAAYHRCGRHPVDADQGLDIPCDPRAKCGWKDSIVLNCPPQHAKSAIFTVWMTVWRLCQSRDFKRIIISATETQAKEWVDEIAGILDTNEGILAMFGAFHDDSARCAWRPAYGQLRVAGNTGVLRGYNVTAKGLDSKSIPGMRADEIVCDDLITPQTCATAESRGKSEHVFFNVIMTRVITGRVWIVGTRWHQLDLYSKLLEANEPDADWAGDHGTKEVVWEHINFPALRDPVTGEASIMSDAIALWPEFLNAERMLSQKFQRRIGGTYNFSLTYQQNPLDSDAALVMMDWIEGDSSGIPPGCLDRDRSVMDKVPPVPEGHVRVAGFDPSPSNWAALVIADVDLTERPQFHAVVRYIGRWRGGIKEANREFARMAEWYHPTLLIIERNQYAMEYLLNPEFQTMMKSAGIRVRGHETGWNKHDPQYGIQKLAAPFEFGWIRLPYADVESRSQSLLLIHEATRYIVTEPKASGTTDVLMALWFLLVNLPYLAVRGSHIGRTNTGSGWQTPAWAQSSWSAAR